MTYATLDKVDFKILSLLAEDGRLSVTELADRISLSHTPTLKRMRQLETSGFIQGYRAVLDESRLGGSMTVFTWVSLSTQKKEALTEFETFVTNSPEVMDCFLMTGDSDYLMRVAIDSLTEFENFLSGKLSRLKSVNSIKSSFALRPIVQKSLPPVIRASRPSVQS